MRTTQEASRAAMFTEGSTDEEESHHLRDRYQIRDRVEAQTSALKSPHRHEARASTDPSVTRATKGRRNMFMELQRRRKKHGMVKGDEDTPNKPDANDLRNIYLQLYDKIHDETGKSLEQLEAPPSFGEESEDGNDYAVVWAASEENSLSSQQHPKINVASFVDNESQGEDILFDHSEHSHDADPRASQVPRDDYTTNTEVSASSRAFMDANEFQSSSDSDSLQATEPMTERDGQDESTHDGNTLLPNATSTTHPDRVEEMVSTFLNETVYSPLQGIEEENHGNPKIDSRVHFPDQLVDEGSVESEEDRTLADSTMVSGLSASSHTHDLSMDETIESLGASRSRSRSSRSSSNSCEMSEVPPEIPHPLGPISEYQVLYQISEEDEEAETDASSEDAHEIPFDEEGTEASTRSDRKWSFGSIIRSVLRWTVILVVANSFGFFHWLLDVPLSVADNPTGLTEEVQDPIRIIRGMPYFEISAIEDHSIENEKEPLSITSILLQDDHFDNIPKREVYNDHNDGEL